MGAGRPGQRRRSFSQDIARGRDQDVLDIDEAPRPALLVADARYQRHKEILPGPDHAVAGHGHADDLHDQVSVQGHRRVSQLAHGGRGARDVQVPRH